MAYSWDPRGFAAVAAVPSAAIDEHLRLASKAPAKVLLWLARYGCTAWDVEACARACGLTTAAAQEGLEYWIAAGVVQDESAPVAVAAAPVAAPVTSTAAVSVAAVTTVARPSAVKPTMKEVLARQQADAEYRYLLDTVSARLGKPLTHGDMETLLYLTDQAGLPAAVLHMIVEYAVSQGKYHMRYIEKVALDWSDREITTVEAAEKQLCALQRRRQAWDTVSGWLDITSSPTVAQSEAAERWLYDWQMDEPLVRLAAAMCREKTGKLQCAYVGKILERWHIEGIDTVEKAQAEQSSKRTGGKKNKPPHKVSFDLEDYETMVSTYTPVYGEGS